MTRDAPIWRAPNIGSLEFAQKLSLCPLQSHQSQKLDARCAEPAKLERDRAVRPATWAGAAGRPRRRGVARGAGLPAAAGKLRHKTNAPTRIPGRSFC